MPEISVIVPIYKVENYIHRCIDSILAQTFTDFELILVDDGSPDDCGKICDEYAKTDSRIHVIHKENGGLSDARNAGIDYAFEHSKSEWITFIDSDDWIHPKYLEVLYNAVIETGCNISVCGFKKTDGENPFVDNTNFIAEVVNTESFFCEHNVNAVVAWGKLYKKSFFHEIRYPVGKLHEDEFVTYKLLFRDYQIAFVNEPLYSYFYNPNSITKAKWSPSRLDALEAKKESLLFFSDNHFQIAYFFAISSFAELAFGNYYGMRNNEGIDNAKKLSLIIRKDMRLSLKLGKKHNLFPFNDYLHYYEIAFPVEMQVFWYWKALKKKLKRN